MTSTVKKIQIDVNQWPKHAESIWVEVGIFLASVLPPIMFLFIPILCLILKSMSNQGQKLADEEKK